MSEVTVDSEKKRCNAMVEEFTPRLYLHYCIQEPRHEGGHKCAHLKWK